MASQTITTSGAEDTRIATAFGKRLRLGRNATAAEVKAAQIEWIKGVVRDEEAAAAALAAAQPDVAPT